MKLPNFFYWRAGCLFAITVTVCLVPLLGVGQANRNVEENADTPAMGSVSNLIQIGSVLLQYAADHKGLLPPSLGDIYPTYANDLEVFKGPLMSEKINDENDIDARGAYAYVAARARCGSPHLVVAYEKSITKEGKGLVLWGDGRVTETSEEELFAHTSQQTSHVLMAITSPGNGTALFRDINSGKSFALREGDVFEDFTLVDLSNLEVTIKRGKDAAKATLALGERLVFTNAPGTLGLGL